MFINQYLEVFITYKMRLKIDWLSHYFNLLTMLINKFISSQESQTHFTIITFNHFKSFVIFFKIVGFSSCDDIKQRLWDFLFVYFFWLIWRKFTIASILPKLSPRLKVKLPFFNRKNFSIFKENQCSILLVQAGC